MRGESVPQGSPGEAECSAAEDPVLNALARVAAVLCGAPLAFLWAMEADGTHRVGRIGFPASSVPRARELAKVVMARGDAVVVSDARVDSELQGTGAVPLLGTAVAGVPLPADWGVVGALCVMDVMPRVFEEQTAAILRALAGQAVEELLARGRPGYEVGALLSAVADVVAQDALAAPLDRARLLLGADTARLLLLREDGRSLGGGLAYGLEAELADATSVPVGEGFAGVIAASGRPLVVDDIEQHPVVSQILRDAGIRSLAGCPLTSQGRLLGVMHVGSFKTGHFSPRDLPVLQSIAAPMAVALDVASRDVAVRDALERLSVVIDSTLDPLAWLQPIENAEGEISDFMAVRMNDAHLRAGTRAGRNVPLHLKDTAPEAFELCRRALVSGEPVQARRVRVRRFGGDEEYVDVRATPLDGEVVVAWRNVTSDVRLEERIRRDALYDSLTGLANRTLFLERLDGELARLQRRPEPLGVLFIDLDRFKPINDRYGHAVGDGVLREVADRIRASVRPGDLVARLAGDEFAILCPDAGEVRGMVHLAERILEALEEPIDLPDSSRIIPCGSVGISLASASDASAESLLQEADEAMYVAKHSGGRRVSVYEQAMSQRAGRRLVIEGDLHRALKDGWLYLVYQPIVRLSDREIVGAEALLRMNHPTRGQVSPEEFIDVAESSHMIGPIGEWVLREACRQAATWARPLSVSVNVSARQAEDLLVAQQTQLALHESGLNASRVSLEITERLLLDATEAVFEQLQELKAMGVRLTLDDFGTGYSSLSYLHRFSVDTVKIDRSFVHPIESDSRARLIVTAVTALARALGLDVVAEGLEQPEQVGVLASLGCTLGQGHVFSPPLPAEEFAALLQR